MRARALILVAVLAGFAGAFLLHGAARGPDRDAGSRPATLPSRPAPVAAGAAADVEARLPRLIDLGADKCIPCKKMAPILEELSETHRDVFVVEFIDVWKHPEAARQWGIRLIPTQIFIDAQGNERWRHEGFLGRQAILDTWRELGIAIPASAAEPGS